jgi:hypothetical protein
MFWEVSYVFSGHVRRNRYGNMPFRNLGVDGNIILNLNLEKEVKEIPLPLFKDTLDLQPCSNMTTLLTHEDVVHARVRVNFVPPKSLAKKKNVFRNCPCVLGLCFLQ